MYNNNSSKLFSGLSVQTIITIILAVLELFYFSIISRLLSKTDFGYFAAATGIMSIFTSLSEAGLGAAIIQKKRESSEHVSTAFTLSLLLGLVFSSIVYVSAFGLAMLIADDTLTVPIRLLSVTVLFHCLNSCGNAMLYRKFNFKRVGLNTILSQVISYSIAIYLAIKGYGLYAVVANSVILSIVNFILLYIFSIKVPEVKIYKKEIKGIVSFGGWLTLSTLANNVMQQIDKLLLPKWISVQALGAYNRPAGFLNTVSTKINSIFDTVLFPMLSSIQDDCQKIKSVFSRAVELLNAFSVVLAFCIFFNAHLLIRLFFGEDWLDLTIIFQIISLNLIFNIDNRLVDCFFRSLNFVKAGFFLRCFGLLSVLFAIYIGSKHGLQGVAIGVVTANIVTIMLKMVFLSNKINFSAIQMCKIWISSWKSSIPLIVVGAFSPLWCNNIWFELANAFLFGIIIIVECLFFPQILGHEYCNTIYPKIKHYIKPKNDY
ncbi:lipopolysaccharide biosynthesis protein [Bacteroides pyogenes]|uniref:lipopolysaccharide biosynthesis protein n=1 Tax=Bacteroides pyogenes TaxID=310300 RepID=UPI0011E4A1A5|nr:lipopolysaccharide biosynthesis protein [Bacteroides pyogenes]TYK37816.1 lipopolysaccharide biosynthesis protein [Bacteroides pyogenes]